MKYYNFWCSNLRGLSFAGGVEIAEGVPVLRTDSLLLDLVHEHSADSAGSHTAGVPADNRGRRPCHTILFGENGVGKSAILEALSLPALMSNMDEGKAEDLVDPDNAVIRIVLTLRRFKGRKRGFVWTKPHPIWFYAPKRLAAQLTGTLTEGIHLDKWRYVCSDKEFGNLAQNLSAANHPFEMLDAGTTTCAPVDGRTTERSALMARESGENDAHQKRRNLGTCVYINSDVNRDGIGLFVLETPKNLTSDAAKLFHRKLPATDEQGYLRDIEKLNNHWNEIFDLNANRSSAARDPVEMLDKDKGPRRLCIQSMQCGDDHTRVRAVYRAKGEDIESFGGEDDSFAISFLSSGLNEAFMILATIICSRLENCVILLDEPELHLAPETSRRFYQQLAALSRPHHMNLQLIVCSHSPLTPLAEFSNWRSDGGGSGAFVGGAIDPCRLSEVVPPGVDSETLELHQNTTDVANAQFAKLSQRYEEHGAFMASRSAKGLIPSNEQ